MQKTIRVLAIIATALVAVTLLLLVVSMPLQRVIAKEIFNYSPYVIAELPIIVPILPVWDMYLHT